jgi:hypothetical protein
MLIGNDDRLMVAGNRAMLPGVLLPQGSIISFRASSIFLDLDKLTSRY